MNRRQILKSAVGAGVATAAGVSPAQAAKGMTNLGTLRSRMDNIEGPMPPEEAPLWRQALEKAICRRRMVRDAHYAPPPAHIAAMKSWSPAFKASETAKEQLEHHDLHNALWGDDDAVVMALAKKMGIL